MGSCCSPGEGSPLEISTPAQKTRVRLTVQLKYGMSMIEILKLIHSEGIRGFMRTVEKSLDLFSIGRTIWVHRGCYVFPVGKSKDNDVF